MPWHHMAGDCDVACLQTKDSHDQNLYLWKFMLLNVFMSTICRRVSLVSKSLFSFTACSIWSWLVVSGKDWKGTRQYSWLEYIGIA